MQYQITSDNIDLSPSMEVLTKEKFERIEGRFKHLPEGSCFARVVLNSVPDGQFEVKASLDLSGKEYFCKYIDYFSECFRLCCWWKIPTTASNKKYKNLNKSYGTNALGTGCR